MKSCPHRGLVQDYLDDQLADPAARAFEEHAAGCPDCAGEIALYRRTFAFLDDLPLRDPSPALVPRVLERVLPSRVRRRWVTAAGWGYAGALAVCLMSLVLWFSQPGPKAWLESMSSVVSRGLVQSIIFVMNTLAFGVVSLATGWGLVAGAAARLAPLGRALTTVLSHPAFQTTLVLAAVSCAVVLWWMRSRERDSGNGVRHVSVLGF